jgi:hypothetical protein
MMPGEVETEIELETLNKIGLGRNGGTEIELETLNKIGLGRNDGTEIIVCGEKNVSKETGTKSGINHMMLCFLVLMTGLNRRKTLTQTNDIEAKTSE